MNIYKLKPNRDREIKSPRELRGQKLSDHGYLWTLVRLAKDNAYELSFDYHLGTFKSLATGVEVPDLHMSRFEALEAQEVSDG